MKVGDIIGDRKITKIIKEFPILYSGWELDNVGYVVEHERIVRKNVNEKRKVSFALSGHGVFQLVDSNDFVMEKIEEYQKALSTTRVALELKLGVK